MSWHDWHPEEGERASCQASSRSAVHRDGRGAVPASTHTDEYPLVIMRGFQNGTMTALAANSLCGIVTVYSSEFGLTVISERFNWEGNRSQSKQKGTRARHSWWSPIRQSLKSHQSNDWCGVLCVLIGAAPCLLTVVDLNAQRCELWFMPHSSAAVWFGPRLNKSGEDGNFLVSLRGTLNVFSICTYFGKRFRKSFFSGLY